MSETYKENICRVFPKEDIVSLKEDSDLFLTAIQNNFCRELSARLMEILKSNDEVAVKLSDIRSFDEYHLNEVHYVQHFQWTPLIRCKDCKHYDPYDSGKAYCCPEGVDGCYPDDFCSHGERREEKRC